MMLRCGLLCSVVSAISSACDPIQLVLVIEASSSVSPENFVRQLELANSVIASVRELYSPNSGVTWTWGAVKFFRTSHVMKEMHVDGGPEDMFNVTQPHVRGAYTEYKSALKHAKSLFKGNATRFIWVLTDGEPTDIESVEEMKEFRSEWNADEDITVTSALFSNSSSEKALPLLQALSCPNNTTCTDRVVVSSALNSTAEFEKKVKDMQRKVIWEPMSDKCNLVRMKKMGPLIAVIVVLVLGSIIGVIFCVTTMRQSSQGKKISGGNGYRDRPKSTREVYPGRARQLSSVHTRKGLAENRRKRARRTLGGV